jgi:hypothetical protein
MINFQDRASLFTGNNGAGVVLLLMLRSIDLFLFEKTPAMSIGGEILDETPAAIRF